MNREMVLSCVNREMVLSCVNRVVMLMCEQGDGAELCEQGGGAGLLQNERVRESFCFSQVVLNSCFCGYCLCSICNG